MIKKFKVNMNKRKEKINFFKFSEEIDEQSAVILPNIILTGNRAVKIEGCKSIIEYNETFVKLNLGKGCLGISGNRLNIVLLDSDEVKVSGEIISVEFC